MNRFLSLLLTVALLLTLVPAAAAAPAYTEGDETPSVYDADTGNGDVSLLSVTDTISPSAATNIIEARLAQFQQLYPKGTTNTNCFTFAQTVQNFLFDQSFNYSYHGNFRENGHLDRIGRLGYDCDPDDETNNSVIGTTDGPITTETVQTLLSQAKVGDVIQGLANNDAGMHTMVVQSVTSTGVVVYHGNWNSVVSVTLLTWSYIATKWNHVLTLYRADNYDSIASQTSFTLTFNANGGTVGTTSQKVTWHGTYGTLPTPVRSGYTFLGWYTARTNGTKISSGETVLLGKSTTLYAYWSSDGSSGGDSGTQYIVTASTTLYCRSGPGSSYSILGSFKSGAILTATGASVNGWLPVTDGSLSGWCSLDYLAPYGNSGSSTTITPGLRLVVSTTSQPLYCRSGPGSNYSVITSFSKGSVVVATGESQDGWAEVTYNNITGWCSLDYLTPVSEESCPFTDILETDWYYGDVVWAYYNGIMNGTAATRFSPQSTTSRAMFVTILGRYLESQGKTLITSSATFPDIDQGGYYYDYVLWAIAAGITTGSGGKFYPDEPVSREEMAVFLYRFAQYCGKSVSGVDTTKFYSYSDCGTVSSWALTAMQWAVYKGYLNGSGDKLDPSGDATRAEACAILRRFAG